MAYRRSVYALRTFVDEKKYCPFKLAKQHMPNAPAIVLVRTFLDANIGSISRAMLTFGMHDLRLVDPRCNHLSDTGYHRISVFKSC
jgi:hypothetical protein